MGYGDWTEITIQNTSDAELRFRNASLNWGKFYNCERGTNKDEEIEPGSLGAKVIPAHGSYTIGACGRENTWSGTEGQFDLYAPGTGQLAATVKFYSPHGSSYNSVNIDCPNKEWSAGQNGAYLGNDKPLGAFTVTVAHAA
ncbi:Aegerolysin [Punctularia strigosozonata HHB-11173 SS5]|uniref:Aegerolysin n=1 Tax=Punctularia strigosozonata (strain HHB-11173) TaxID=741275 RepID=UPI0004417EF0|nr:Aegerolysin [Punctularia strigosozonata HHB-11173 SS5]EIN09992.1 Aegerolysin [Punctularia strigosozonata HHB-11173 SS5]